MNKTISWATIPEFNGRYLISNFGDVKSIFISKSGKEHSRILRPRIHNEYYRVALQLDGFRVDKSNHRLVAELFINNPCNKPQVNHIDGNKLNNHVENLEWCSASENSIHAYKNKLRSPIYGESHGRSKLDSKKIIAIRALYSSKTISQKEIAAIFNVTQTTISAIILNKRWNNH